MKKLRRINYIVLTLLSCIPVLAKQYIANAEGILNTNNTPNSVWVDGNNPILFSEKFEEKADSNRLQKSNTITDADPDLTFNVAEPASPKKKPNGEIDYYSICKSNASDLNPVTFKIYPLNSISDYIYTIDWGDGTPVFTGQYTTGKPFEHNYLNSVNGEFWNIKYKITYLGNEFATNYNLYVGSTPELDIRIPPSIKLCVEEPYSFKLENRVTNSADTKYNIEFNDGSPTVKGLVELPTELIHAFKKTSCGINSTVGTNSRPNSYSLTITAENNCGKSSITIAGIYVSQAPEVKLDQEPIVKCVDEEFPINGIVVRGTSPDDNSILLGVCQETGVAYWEFRNEAGDIVTFNKAILELKYGSFGNNNGFSNFTDFLNWTPGTPDVRVIFRKTGVYTAHLNAGNRCGGNVVPQTIIINPSITPQIKKNAESINCNYLKFTLSNATSQSLLGIQEINTPGVNNFEWNIYKNGSLIKTINQSYKNGVFTPATITEEYSGPNTSGTYSARLTYLGNECSNNTDTETFEVPGDAVVEIMDMDACVDASGNAKITAKVDSKTFNTYGEKITDYKWEIVDAAGNLLFMDEKTGLINNLIIIPFEFTITKVGSYKATLTITTSCGTYTFSKNFVVAPTPVITKINNIDVTVIPTPQINITFCKEQITFPIKIEGNDATSGKVIDGTIRKFFWKNNHPEMGLPENGYDDIPVFTPFNLTTQPIVASIIIYPLNDGCQGNPVTFTITVNPSIDIAEHKMQIICSGDSLEPLDVIYNGIENNTTAKYQWYLTDGVQQPQLISGANSAEFTPLNKLIGTTYYFCQISPVSGSGCSSFNSLQDTIIVNPAAQITDYTIKVVKSALPMDLTPIDVQNGNIIPAGTQYKWIIASQDLRIIGATESADFTDKIQQILDLPMDFTDPFAEIIYYVTAKTGDCEKVFVLKVKVVPGITAIVNCKPILCYGGTASIEITNIYGIMSGNTIVRLLDKNNNDLELKKIITTDNSVTFNNLLEGSYKITIIDENGIYDETGAYVHECFYSQPALLKFKDELTKSYDVKCIGANNGEIFVEIDGGTKVNDYKFLWEKKVDSGSFIIYTTYTNPRVISNLSPGEYRLTVTDDNGCSINKTLTVLEPSALSFSTTVTPVLNCDDNPNKGGKIVVSSPGGGMVSSVNNYRFTWYKKSQTPESTKETIAEINNLLSDIQEGTYIVTIYDDNNCAHSEEIKINRAPALTATVDSVLTFDCENHIIFKSFIVTPKGGVGDYTINWYDGPDLLLTGNTYVPNNNLNGKLITVKVTDERSCVFTITVEPFVLHLPIFDFKYTQTGCNKYKFEAIVPPSVLGLQHTFKWNFANQHTGVGRNTEYDLDNIQVNANGEYVVQLIVVDNFTPCEYPVATKTFKKNFIPDLNVSSTGGSVENINNNITIWFCDGETITVNGEGANTYSWNTGANTDNINISNEGHFTLWGKNGLGCESSLSFNTKFYKWNYSISSDKDEINLGESVSFTTQPIVPFTQSYLWSFGDGTEGSTVELPYEHTYQFFAQDYFDVLLTAINPKGCKEYASKRIKINIGNFPNTILPNSRNDDNRVFMKGCQVQIYNRNGVLIHEGADGWDGTHNGKLVSNDTYFYILIYLQSDGSQQTKKGYVTVIR